MCSNHCQFSPFRLAQMQIARYSVRLRDRHKTPLGNVSPSKYHTAFRASAPRRHIHLIYATMWDFCVYVCVFACPRLINYKTNRRDGDGHCSGRAVRKPLYILAARHSDSTETPQPKHDNQAGIFTISISVCVRVSECASVHACFYKPDTAEAHNHKCHRQNEHTTAYSCKSRPNVLRSPAELVVLWHTLWAFGARDMLFCSYANAPLLHDA